MTVDNEIFLRTFYQKVDLRAYKDGLGDLYVPLHGPAQDTAVSRLCDGIEWAGGASTQLFSGHRGTGKTTELRALADTLRDNGYVVAYCDMQEHLHLTSPIGVPDFLLAVCDALGKSLSEHKSLEGRSLTRQGLIERLWSFVADRSLEVTEVGAKVNAGAVETEVRANLKVSPSFKTMLQERTQGHLGAFVRQAHDFVTDCVASLRKVTGNPDLKIVAIFDSIEQVRGTYSESEQVIQSIEQLFGAHVDKLRLPDVHVIYTVPPWLKIRWPGVGNVYGGFEQIPCVMVRDREGQPNEAGLAALRNVIERREPDWRRAFGDEARLNKLILASGGYLRDLLRLVQTALRLGRWLTLPLDAALIDRAVADVQRSYLPLTHRDARWMHQVHLRKHVGLGEQDDLPELVRLFDTMLVLSYVQADEWWDIHPLVADEVNRLATQE